jgi:hypothetical protein
VNADPVDPVLLQRLSNQLSRGQAVLFTGAGFSMGASSRAGGPIPGVGELRESLWRIAFPGEPLDDASTIGDIFDVALRTAQNRTREFLEQKLRVDAQTLPESYAVWFSMPWAHIYTLNVDDLDDAVARTFDLPRRLNVISAIAQEPITTRNGLASVHLNGKLEDFPNVTFSQRQYGERLAQPDLWFQALVRDLRAMPVVYVGTTLDEPPLWQHIEMRGRRQARSRELRPGSYLVSPALSAARRANLKEHFNVDWIPLTTEEFAERVLSQLEEAQRAGIQYFVDQSAVQPAHALLDVADLRAQPAQDLREYVMGREPVWADLSEEGFAVPREFEGRIEADLEEKDARALIITGTGGSGKSTTLMRFALGQQAAGRDVRWVDLSEYVSIPRLRTAIRESAADVVAIDDAESFGDQTGPLLAELLADNEDLFVAAAVRASKYEPLAIDQHLADYSSHQVTVPLLGDEDIDALLDTLSRAQRLGVLRGKTRPEQREIFANVAGRQLLVAMIEATTGERFEEKINRECHDLGPEAGLMYAVTSIATAARTDLTRQEVVLASGDSTNEGLNRLQGLINQHLLVTSPSGRIKVRHRVIADRAVDYFALKGS